MNRTLALIGTLLLSFLSIAAACAAIAATMDPFFTLESRHGGAAGSRPSFRSDDGTQVPGNNWSSGFRPSELVGLDLASFLGRRCPPATLLRDSRGRST